MFKKIYFVIALVTVILFGCDKGIAPGEPAGPSGFSGKIIFNGTWPSGIKRTHLVVFKNEIKDTSDFFPPNLSFVSDSIPYGSSIFNFNSLTNNFLPALQFNPGSYSYVAVAQSKTENISLRRKDWFVVGIYCVNNDQAKPAALTIHAGKITEGVNINVDFNNVPPQPPQ